MRFDHNLRRILDYILPSNWRLVEIRRSEWNDALAVYLQETPTGRAADFSNPADFSNLQYSYQPKYLVADMPGEFVYRLQAKSLSQQILTVQGWLDSVLPNEKGPRRSSQEPIPPELGEECL